jgi:hypothetical protein
MGKKNKNCIYEIFRMLQEVTAVRDITKLINMKVAATRSLQNNKYETGHNMQA